MRLSGGVLCDVESVRRVRALLSDGRPAERSAAIECIGSWRSVDDDPATASAVLNAATSVPAPAHAETHDVAATLVEVLWRTPHRVRLDEIEAAYLLAREPVRRALLDLLARRRDPDALVSLRHVVGDPGWTDHLPLPSPGLLSAVLGHAQVEELVELFGALLLRPGWERHAAGLLVRLAREVGLSTDARTELVEVLEPALDASVEECDEAIGCRNGGESSNWIWRSRHRVRQILDVLESIDADVVDDLLVRTMSSADPVVGAWGVVGLTVRGVEVPWDRIWMAVHEPVSRSVLMDRLDRFGLLGAVLDRAGRQHDGVMRAEADLVAWLARPGELGCLPAEVEHLAVRTVELDSGPAGFHLFRFRTLAPHWASDRGWMVGAAGVYHDDGTVPEGVPRVAVSQYEREDDASLEEHFEAMADAAGDL